MRETTSVRRRLREHGTPMADVADAPEGWPADRVTMMELASGTQLRIRPALPDDGVELQEGLKRLSERTRWLRFHAPVDHLTNAQLRYLVEVDHHDREALVAEVRVAVGNWQPVAVARWDCDRERPEQAEIAIVVEDAYQGRGIGRRLLARLAEVAVEEGITLFTGEILAENRDMLAMLDHIGVATEATLEGTVVHTRTWLVNPTTPGRQAAAG
ncbi:MAG TPA: GNAT family N-acetyltransferase [Nitriliruptorales bacterium]